MQTSEIDDESRGLISSEAAQDGGKESTIREGRKFSYKPFKGSKNDYVRVCLEECIYVKSCEKPQGSNIQDFSPYVGNYYVRFHHIQSNKCFLSAGKFAYFPIEFFNMKVDRITHQIKSEKNGISRGKKFCFTIGDEQVKIRVAKCKKEFTKYMESTETYHPYSASAKEVTVLFTEITPLKTASAYVHYKDIYLGAILEEKEDN